MGRLLRTPSLFLSELLSNGTAASDSFPLFKRVAVQWDRCFGLLPSFCAGCCPIGRSLRTAFFFLSELLSNGTAALDTFPLFKRVAVQWDGLFGLLPSFCAGYCPIGRLLRTSPLFLRGLLSNGTAASDTFPLFKRVAVQWDGRFGHLPSF